MLFQSGYRGEEIKSKISFPKIEVRWKGAYLEKGVSLLNRVTNELYVVNDVGG